MTKDDVRAAAKRLVEFHEQFAPTLRQGPSPGQCLHLHQGLDDLSRAQEYRADRAERGQRQCLGDAEVHQQRPLGPRRNPSRPPACLRQGAGAHRGRQPDRSRGRCRRECLYQEGRQERGSRPSTQRSPGQGRQLPGRGLCHGSHSRGNGPACASVVSARALVRADRTRARSEGTRPMYLLESSSGPSPRSPRI